MIKRIGKSAITWTSTDDTPIIERVHELRVPLFDARPAHTLQVFGGTSLDGSVREAFTIESGANDLLATVRLDENPQSLMDLVKAGSRNTTLTYYPSLSDAGTSFDVQLISPLTPAEVDVDPQLGNRGDRSVELRFRRTDQSAFRAEAFRGTNVLFKWKAGDELSGATFTRADDATRIKKGYGTLENTTDGRPRTNWVSTAGTTGYRDTPAMLLEGARTNYVEDSEDFSQWTNVNTVGLTSGQAGPYGGTAAFLITDDSTANTERVGEVVALDSSGPFGCSLFVKTSTGNSTVGVTYRVIDLDSTVTRMNTVITWSSGVPVQSVTVGSTYIVPEPFVDGWWRITALTDTNITTGSSNRLEILPADTPTTGEAFIFGAQVE